MTRQFGGSDGKRRTTAGSWAKWSWLAAYVVMLGIVVVSMIGIRRATIRSMSTPAAQAEWQAWRESEPNQTEAGGVKRRPPSSGEPPALVLLRDHFAVMIAGALLFSSLLFGAIMVAARGTFASTAHDALPGPDDTDDV